MEIMLVAATALSVVPLLLSLLMPDWYLGDQQNAVEELDADTGSRRGSVVYGEERSLLAPGEDEDA